VANPKIEAAPGRVILRFPKPAEKIGMIHVSQKSQRRPELGEIVSLGDALSAEDAICRKWLAAQHEAGKRIPVTIASGIGYWQEEFNEFGDEFLWLKDLRVYRISELAAAVVGVQELGEVEGVAV
jgi:hypothetical protein